MNPVFKPFLMAFLQAQTGEPPPGSDGDPWGAVVSALQGAAHDSSSVPQEGDKQLFSNPAEILQPFCPYAMLLGRVGLQCLVIRTLANAILEGPPDFELMTTEAHAKDPLGLLPEPLVDMRGRHPAAIDPLLVRLPVLCGALVRC
jgi:hypothetical protein